MIKNIFTGLVLLGSSAFAQQPMIQTDLSKVYQAGELNTLNQRVQLHAGMYIVGD